MQIERPHPKIGALVSGVDVRQLSDADWQTLYRTWLDSIVMIVRGQTLTKEEFLAYSRRFGRLKPHRVRKTRDPELPELTVMGIGTKKADGQVNQAIYNRGGHWHAEGSYDLVADKLFNALDIDVFFLEYDSPRAGDFSPLRLVPKGKTIVLGLVSTKAATVEDRAALKRRIEEASRHVDLDRLGLSPQCGFASSEEGNPIPAAAQEAKLRLVVEVARDVWGES